MMFLIRSICEAEDLNVLTQTVEDGSGDVT